MQTHISRCDYCGREFQSENSLAQHMKTHRPKNVSCPICGEQRIGSAANAVAHVESGYCSGCRGQDEARRQIYQYVSGHAPNLCVPMLENGGHSDQVPNSPYKCTYCGKQFGQLSSQMNHEQDVHHNDRRMQQLGW